LKILAFVAEKKMSLMINYKIVCRLLCVDCCV